MFKHFYVSSHPDFMTEEWEEHVPLDSLKINGFRNVHGQPIFTVLYTSIIVKINFISNIMSKLAVPKNMKNIFASIKTVDTRRRGGNFPDK